MTTQLPKHAYIQVLELGSTNCSLENANYAIDDICTQISRKKWGTYKRNTNDVIAKVV